MSRPAAPQEKLLPHPLADLMPAMSDDEFRDLCRSIRVNGFLSEYKIVLHEGKILDGRHRYRACLKEGVEPEFVAYTGPDPAAFVCASIQRRNLSESTRGLMAAKLLEAQQGKQGNRLQHADVRRIFGVGETTVTESVRVLKNGVPELEKLIENGEIKVKQAAEIVRLDRKEQARVVAAGPKAVAAKATELRKSRQAGSPLTPKGVPGRPPAAPPARQFDMLTAELLRDLRSMAARFTRLLQTADGKRFEQYIRQHQLPWIDYGKVRLVDKGEGLKKVNASFVALRPVYRLLVAAARDRAFPAATLKGLLLDETENVLDGTVPPPEPEDDHSQLVTPETLD